MPIRTVYHVQPPAFPATDQHPQAQRAGPFVIAGVSYWADYTGAQPVAADVQAVLDSAKVVLVSKLTVIDRLQDAGKLQAMRTALDGASIQVRERFAARQSFRSDDQAFRAMLTALGADPDAILAPE